MQLLSRIAELLHQNYVLSLLQTSFSVSCVSGVWKECTKAPHPTVGGVGGNFSETRVVLHVCRSAQRAKVVSVGNLMVIPVSCQTCHHSIARPFLYSPLQRWLCDCEADTINIFKNRLPGVPKKPDPLAYFDDNFGKYGPILTIFSLLQQEIQSAQKLSYFYHLTFIMLPLYLAKQTLMLVLSFDE